MHLRCCNSLINLHSLINHHSLINLISNHMCHTMLHKRSKTSTNIDKSYGCILNFFIPKICNLGIAWSLILLQNQQIVCLPLIIRSCSYTIHNLFQYASSICTLNNNFSYSSDIYNLAITNQTKIHLDIQLLDTNWLLCDFFIQSFEMKIRSIYLALALIGTIIYLLYPCLLHIMRTGILREVFCWLWLLSNTITSNFYEVCGHNSTRLRHCEKFKQYKLGIKCQGWPSRARATFFTF